jgi:hypothetical protein
MRAPRNLGLLSLFLAVGCCAELDAKALAALVQAQSKQIKALENKLSGLSRKVGSKGSCAAGGDMDDPEPEVYSFKAIERQRAAAKKQEDLQTIFNVTVRTTASLPRGQNNLQPSLCHTSNPSSHKHRFANRLASR